MTKYLVNERKYDIRFNYYRDEKSLPSHRRTTKLWWKPMMWIGYKQWFRYNLGRKWEQWVRHHVTFD